MNSLAEKFSITIIIPVLNEEASIGGVLAFLFSKSDPRITNIIVVDAGSSDRTVKIAERFKVDVIHSEKRNRAIQMNLGAHRVTSGYLYFLHADTIPPDSYLDDLEKIIKSGSYAGSFRLKFSGGPWLLRLNAFFTRFQGMTFRGGDQSLFIQLELFKSLMGYDESFTIMEEYDLIRRILTVTSFSIIPKPVKVSTRKYIDNSYIRVSMANYKAIRMFLRGESPVNISSFYKNYLSKIR